MTKWPKLIIRNMNSLYKMYKLKNWKKPCNNKTEKIINLTNIIIYSIKKL